MHSGFKVNLEKHVKEMLGTRAIELAEHVLKQPETHNLLDAELWLTDLDKVVKPAVEVEVIKRLWKAVFEAITQGIGDDLQMRADAFLKDLDAQKSKHVLLGRRLKEASAVFFAVLNAALHGGLQAACTVAEAEEDEQLRLIMAQIQKRYDQGERQDPVQYSTYNRKMFELAWKAARDGALSSAKEVVNKSRNVNRGARNREWHQVRDKMWAEVWVVWNDCWDRAQPAASEKLVGKLAKIIDHIITTYDMVVTEPLQNATVRASIPAVNCSFVS